MSKQNGDKARYQRVRQAGLRRRERSRQVQVELRQQAAAKAAAAGNLASGVTPTDAGVESKAEGI
jgi:hypothetical protein